MSKRWDSEEEDFLRQNKGRLSHEEMAIQLGRTPESVHRKISRLGIAKPRTGSRLHNGEKRCSKCCAVKTASDFANNAGRVDGKDVWCKPCRSIRLREMTYNLNPGEYEQRREKQKGLCAICCNADDNLFVDHDHASGFVRGLLCSQCNFMIGHSRDNPRSLARGILYLKQNGIRISPVEHGGQSLSAEFLASRQQCCGNGCKNCPY